MDAPIGIEIFDNAKIDCLSIIEYLNKENNWNKSSIGYNGNLSNDRTSSTHFIPMFSFINPDYIHNMNKTVWQYMNDYAKKWKFYFSSIEDVSVQKYEIGEKYNAHFDDSVNFPRTFSALLYLNTVNDGGETYFTNFDYKIKPIEGRLAIFPSNYIYEHSALPPISNIKYAAAFWARM